MPIRVTNIEAGYYDKRGFHPLRRSLDYDPDRAGDDYSSQQDSMGLRYRQKSKAARAHKFVRGVAVNPGVTTAVLNAVRPVHTYTDSELGRMAIRYSGRVPTWQIAGRPYVIVRTGTSEKRIGAALRAAARKERWGNPIPTDWAPAKVRRLKSGAVQVMIPQRSRKRKR